MVSGGATTASPMRRRMSWVELVEHHGPAFWALTKKTDECWIWEGKTNAKGYGHRGNGRNGTGVLAHRLSWMIHHGEIPPDVLVCHRCDNPPCVRPDHLFLGTAEDNNRDRQRKGRTVIPHGETHHSAHLTAADVSEIRLLHAFGARCYVLAAEYGVTRPAMSQLLLGRTWKSVSP